MVMTEVLARIILVGCFGKFLALWVHYRLQFLYLAPTAPFELNQSAPVEQINYEHYLFTRKTKATTSFRSVQSYPSHIHALVLLDFKS